MNSIRPVVRPETFAVHYQPVLDLECAQAARRAGGAALAEGTRWLEALVRWPANDGSFLAPDDPGAPELDVATADAAIEIAVRDAMRWRARAMNFRVGVNLSTAQLNRPHVAQRMGDLVDASGGRRDDLIVEVSADELDPARGDRPRRAVGDLCEHGFRLALDEVALSARDIGKLAGLPTCVLKASRRLVAAAEHDPEAAATLEGLAVFARSSGMTPLAVGIETSTQLDLVVGLGYRIGQGFLLSRPLTAAEVTVFCRPLSGESAGAEAARRRLLAAP